MKNIDFLPSRYRERTQLRRVMVWRVAAVSGLGLILVVAHVSQLAMRRNASKQLAAIEPQYVAALETSAQLRKLQSDLAANESYAELYTYLQHPWPTTQLLAAISQTLPETLTLREIRLVHRSGSNAADSTPLVPPPDASPIPPAAKDLKSLRDEIDAGRLVVTLLGTTNDVSALHEYVRGFQRSTYFVSAKLESLESLKDSAGSQASRFEMHLEIRPGFGQPGGPPVGHASPDGIRVEQKQSVGTNRVFSDVIQIQELAVIAA